MKSEWTFGRTLFRIFAYPFCLFLIGIGIYLLKSPFEGKNLKAGLGAIGISVLYIATDIMVLYSKRKKRNQAKENKTE